MNTKQRAMPGPKTVVVTGASRGIGRATALAFAERGWNVVVGYATNLAASKEVVQAIERAGGAAVALPLDQSRSDDVDPFFQGAVEAFGRVDVLVANAGIMRWGRFPEIDRDDLERHLQVHVGGSFLTARAVWPHLVEQGYGRIVMTTSTGMLGLPGSTVYAAAKGGVLGLGRSLATAGAAHGIKVNLIAPAASTRMAGDVGPDGHHGFGEPVSRSAFLPELTPEFAADAAALLETGLVHFFELRTMGGAIADVAPDELSPKEALELIYRLRGLLSG